MSGITLKIDKGQSSAFSEIMGLLQSFPGLKECKKHYSVKLTEEEVFRFRNETGSDYATIAAIEGKGVVRYSGLRDG